MSLSRGHVRMLRQLSADTTRWFKPELVAQNRECVELHKVGYLQRRVTPYPPYVLEYRIDTTAPVVKQAVALGIIT